MNTTEQPLLAFFSYSRHDSEFALKLAKDLRERGAVVWLDQLDINPGERWDSAVEQALANCPKMLVILSPESVGSTNVMDEVSFALEERKVIIPVLHRDCNIPFRLRRIEYIDARKDYERGLHELLRMLRMAPVLESAAIGNVPATAAIRTEPTQTADEHERVEAAKEHGKAKREPVEGEQAEEAGLGRLRQGGDATAASHRLPAGAITKPKSGNSRRTLLIGGAVFVAALVIGVGISQRFWHRDRELTIAPEPQGKAREYQISKEKNSSEMTLSEPRVSTEWVTQFLQVFQGPDVNAIRPYFNDIASPYYDQPSANWAAIAKDKTYYFSRFPTIQYRLVREPEFKPTSAGGVLDFDAAYDNIRKDGHTARGTTHWTIALTRVDGTWKIAGIQERIVKQ